MSVASSILGGVAGGATVSVVITAIDKASPVFANVNKKALAMGGAITAAGATGVIAISNLANEAAKNVPIMDAFNKMFGKEAPQALDKLKEVTKSTISDMNLMTAANQALLLGIDPNALPAMFEGAAAVAQATGRPVSEAINDITLGIGRQSKMILDNLGIIIDVEKANKDYAKSLGKTSGELTDAEKKIAFTNAAMDALATNTEKVGPLQDTASTKAQQMAASFANVKQQLGEQLIPVFEYFIEKIIQPVLDFFDSHPTLLKWAAAVAVVGTGLALILGPLITIVALLPVMAAGLTAVSVAGLPVWVVALIIAAALIALIAVGVLLMKNWEKIKISAAKLSVGVSNAFIQIANVVLAVWNKVVSIVENRINAVIKAINVLVKGLNKVLKAAGLPEMSKLGQVSLSKFEASPFELRTMPTEEKPAATQSTVIIENINGITGRDIADSLQHELGNRTNLGV